MTKIENIKLHVKRNKDLYIVGGACLAVGVVGTYVGYRAGTVRNIENQIKPKIVQALSYKPQATIEVYVEALGDPGNIIQDMTTGSIYASQGQAARELGINPSSMSKHLNGLTEHINGHRFERLGKAIVPQLDAA